VCLGPEACTKASTTLLGPIVRPHAPDFPVAPIVLLLRTVETLIIPTASAKYLGVVGRPARTMEGMTQRL